MSNWETFTTAAPGGESRGTSGAKDAVDVDWLSNGHDIFSGGDDTFLVDPRDVKRAETAPSVLTMFSADGTLCVGGSLEEEVPPEEEYRYSEDYHTLYYSKYPRDPRMLVPLTRRPRGARRAEGAPALPGRPATRAGDEAAPADPAPTGGTAMTPPPALPPTRRAGGRNGHNGGRNGGRRSNGGMAANGASDTPVASRLVGEEFTALREFLDGVRPTCAYADVKGHIVPLSKDQDGSRFVQRLLDEESNIEPIYNEVLANMHELMVDVFGNYVLQKLLDVIPEGSAMSCELIRTTQGRLREYSFHMYGCRVMQKIVERAAPDMRDAVLDELRPFIVDCIFDQNANHVAQKVIEVVPEKSQFVTEDFLPRLDELSCHPYGCRVLQCVFEKCSATPKVNIRPLLVAVLERVHEYVMDQYGNYVVQHALLNAPEDIRHRLVVLLIPHVYALSCSKFASNVAEKTIVLANEEELQRIVETLTRPLGSTEDGNYLVLMMQDPYANYVVQRLLQQVTRPQQLHIAERTRPHIYSIRRSVYGQHLVQKMETMGMFTGAETVGTGAKPPPPHQTAPPAPREAGGATGRGRKGGRGRGRPSLTSLTPPDAPPAVYQPAPAALAAGRGGAAAGPSYAFAPPVPSPPEVMLAPPGMPRHAQAVAVGGQSCYPGMVMAPPQPITLQGQLPYEAYATRTAQPQAQHPGVTDGYAAGFYNNGAAGNWSQQYAPFQPAMQQQMLYSGNAHPATLNAYGGMGQQPLQQQQPMQQGRFPASMAAQGQGFFSGSVGMPIRGRQQVG